MATVAVSRLQGELAKDGREPPAVSKKTHEKSSIGKATVAKSSDKQKGVQPGFLLFLDFFSHSDLTRR